MEKEYLIIEFSKADYDAMQKDSIENYGMDLEESVRQSILELAREENVI